MSMQVVDVSSTVLVFNNILFKCHEIKHGKKKSMKSDLKMKIQNKSNCGLDINPMTDLKVSHDAIHVY